MLTHSLVPHHARRLFLRDREGRDHLQEGDGLCSARGDDEGILSIVMQVRATTNGVSQKKRSHLGVADGGVDVDDHKHHE